MDFPKYFWRVIFFGKKGREKNQKKNGKTSQKKREQNPPKKNATLFIGKNDSTD